MMLKNVFVIILFVVMSCNSTKNQKTNTTENLSEQKNMIADGYIKGIIISSTKDNDCPYVIKIQIDNEFQFVEPVDLPDDLKQDGEVIWFKYTPSRRIQRCDNANPVIINDIKRAD